MTKAAALHQFFSRFSIPCYVETQVPTDAEFPYLTYTPIFDSWGNQLAVTVNLWYRTEGEKQPNDKAQEISNTIGGGKYVPCDGGAILLTRGSPWCQTMTDETDKNIKRRYINVTAEYLTLN